ncbi:hypothetical protein P43SY_008643 [Pythium insidiosum]|uniref:Fcf2 pre-rRNA processing C-terminal domain-containing protein n=1 Tax=Pythium insidiosum TaxID=114742 RepID=A0AAD5M6I1_PYTIN|nr:hypothetical protein P43SY_008643 [Pythium insidiosum]
MVTTRRTSARLQEKQEAAAAASGSDADSAVTPTSARASPRTRRSASKTTPTSATRTRKTPQSSGGKRGRPRKSPTQEEQEAAAAETSTVMEAANAQEEQVTKQLFQGVEEDDGEETASASAEEVETMESVDETADEPSAVDAADAKEGAAVDTEELASDDTVEEAAEVVDVEETTEEEVEDNAVSAAEEPEPEEKQEQEQAEKSDEEEEIVMMEESEEEEEEEEAEAEAEAAAEDAAGDEDDNEEDILAFAQLAASGISLSRSAQSSDKKSGDATASSKLSLVPDTLDSGAASRTKFIDFKGSKLAQGAKLVAETASREETKVLSSQLNRVAKSNRQRQEATDASSAGRKWFGMESHEMTEDARRDFALLRMRNYLDPKKFYKTSDHSKNLPKFFQFGTVVEGAHEFKSARLTKKERQQTFTDEIMADDQIRTYTKRVFSQIQDARVGKGKRKKAKTNLNHRRF